VFLEPDKDPYDLIKLYAIEAGGFSMIARSLEEARSRPSPPKFYLDKQEDTAAIVTEVKKLKAKAMGELQKLFDKHQNKLFLVAKALDPNSMQYKKSTPNDVLYNNLFEFIEGNRTEKDKRKCAQRFLDAAAMDMETLKLKAILKDATFLKLVLTKADGFIYHANSATLMGKNPSECVEFLRNPLQEDVLRSLQGEVERYWSL
jgi:phosphomevalonate kinase